MKLSKTKKTANTPAWSALRSHFAKNSLDALITASRTFPTTSRVDLQLALERLFKENYSAKLVGVHSEYGHETLTIAHLIRQGDHPVIVGPLQHDEIDTGETMPARCLKCGLWLSAMKGNPFVVLLTPAERFGHNEGVH